VRYVKGAAASRRLLALSSLVVAVALAAVVPVAGAAAGDVAVLGPSEPRPVDDPFGPNQFPADFDPDAAEYDGQRSCGDPYWNTGGEVLVALDEVRFTAHRGLFPLHCHNLAHEDTGMMDNLLVE